MESTEELGEAQLQELRADARAKEAAHDRACQATEEAGQLLSSEDGPSSSIISLSGHL